MENYKISIKRSAAKEIEKITPSDRAKVIQKIYSLASDPRQIGTKKLSGSEKYRARQGNYRILYEIFDEQLIITVVQVGHRREIYKK